MEERMIDDEFGRGVRLKKTENGYVDVTDEELENDDENAEEALFEFPVFDDSADDEELATLTPEEAIALKKRREEEAVARKNEYERLCAEGDELLAVGSFHTAELKFEKALLLDEEAVEASVGYWRAKTADFADPDVLVEEYADASIESLEFDLGYKATDILRERYQKVFRRRIVELEQEEAPLVEQIEQKQIKRRAVIKERIKHSAIVTAIAAIPTMTLLILTIVFGLKIASVADDRYILPTIILGSVFFVTFIVFVLIANKLINNLRIYRKNERLSASDDGRRLMEIRDYKTIYQALLPVNVISEDNAVEAEDDE